MLIALAWPQHVHHGQAREWYETEGQAAWSTCPLTQLAFLRISSNPKIIPDAVRPNEALAMLTRIVSLPGHHFWADTPEPVTAANFKSLALIGHRQVTDAYLLTLSVHHQGKLATFDSGILELLTTAKERDRYVAVIA